MHANTSTVGNASCPMAVEISHDQILNSFMSLNLMSEITRLRQRVANIEATGNVPSGALWLRLRDLERKRPRVARKKRKKGPKQPKFYQTREWKQLRYMVLVERGARCECCGSTAADGAKMNVDHVMPISRAWERRLDPTNLQILCGSCNQGKGGRSDDWRD